MQTIEILYLCDGTQCFDGPCQNVHCEHTHDINHAIHKDDLEDRLFRYIDMGFGNVNRIGFFEVESEG